MFFWCCSGLVQQLFDPQQTVCVFWVEGVACVLFSLVFCMMERPEHSPEYTPAKLPFSCYFRTQEMFMGMQNILNFIFKNV